MTQGMNPSWLERQMASWQPGDPLFSRWGVVHQPMFSFKPEDHDEDVSAVAARWSPDEGWQYADGDD